MLSPFAFGSAISDTELPSIGLAILVLAYIAYFHSIYLPIPTIINKGLIASFAIVDSIFLIFFGLDIAAFGAQNLLIFLLSLSITYSILQLVFGSIPTLSDRAKEFISLAVLFVIARTTVVGGVNIIYGVGVALLTVFFPNCAAMTATSMYQIGFVILGIVMILFASFGLSDWLRIALFGFGLFWALLPSFFRFLFGFETTSFQFCAYYWVLQMAMILFLINWILQTLAMDWMGGLVMQVTQPREPEGE
jgi:hypothetical protein